LVCLPTGDCVEELRVPARQWDACIVDFHNAVHISELLLDLAHSLGHVTGEPVDPLFRRQPEGIAEGIQLSCHDAEPM